MDFIIEHEAYGCEQPCIFRLCMVAMLSLPIKKSIISTARELRLFMIPANCLKIIVQIAR